MARPPMAGVLPVLLAAAAAAPAAAAAGPSWVQWLRGAGQQMGLGSGWRERAPSAPNASAWAPLRQLLQGWELTQNYSVAVGTAEHGRLFLYEGGNFTMKTQIPTGSTSKWPSAMLFAGLVNDGTVKSLEDPVYKYLPWWTSDPQDPRSEVTFRMLLSFTSGFGDGHPGEEANTRAARQWRAARNISRAPRTLEERLSAEIGADKGVHCNMWTGDITTCAKSIYENVKLIGKPGQVYSYNGNHLQIAAAVAVATTGLGIHDVIQKYLKEPYGMHDSYYLGKCPPMADALQTTGADYEKFLSGLLGYKTLSKEIIDASEEDATPFMSDFYTLYGNYGFGHFLFCFDSANGMTEQCRKDKVHADPGAFGFIPFIDRKSGYYMEVVAAETPPTGFYPLSGIPEYLAVAVKTHVDAILGANPPDASAHLTHGAGAGLLSLSIADVNYCVNCKLNPAACQ